VTTFVSVRSIVHAVTYLADNVVRSLKDIVRLSGLDPTQAVDLWPILELGIKTWVRSGHLKTIILEVYDPTTDAFLGGWEIEVSYEYSDGDGRFYADTDAIRGAILKQGVLPASSRYQIKVTTNPGRPNVPGWVPATLRSREGFVKQSIGTGVEAWGLSGGFGYYRRA
jgi:hypothetical protein